MSEDFVAQVRQLEQQAASAESSEAAAAYLLDAAEISMDRLSDLERATDLVQQALDHDPTDRDTLTILEMVAQAREDWQLLLETCQRRVDLTEDPAERVELLLRMGAIYDEILADETHAGEIYRQVLDIDPENLVALKRVQQLEEGPWGEAVDEFDATLDGILGEEERVESEPQVDRATMEEVTRGSAFRGRIPKPVRGAEEEPEQQSSPPPAAQGKRGPGLLIGVLLTAVALGVVGWLFWR